ncbi:MAG: DegT/DnrJ/EryC1/StrS family aminotransferase [Pseudobdellovibrionaceae bacterium]
MKKIFVTKPYLPSAEKYKAYIDQIWANEHLTNHGPFLNELEGQLRDLLGTPYLHFVTNGTLALQIALRTLDITEGEVITTPFSYVATTSSILWERCVPVFVDIDPHTFCIDPYKIEEAITPRTKAILAVHVFGYPCDVEAIKNIAEHHHLKVIYDGAHAFGCRYRGRSLLDYGDISTCSFHATKVFHTIEGGCVISHSPELHQKLALIRSFGHIADDHFELGINAKGSEFQAIMGLCNLDDLTDILSARQSASDLYDTQFSHGKLQRPTIPDDFVYNYSYYPVVFSDPDLRRAALESLASHNIFARRYFYPSLNTLPYLTNSAPCPLSESLAQRILSLPFHVGIEAETIHRVADIINKIVQA